jgi:predicted nucleotidyltransferase
MELKELRKTKGLTQKEAAQIAGISFRTYQNYEYGRSKENSFTGRTILEKLGSYEKYSEDKGVLTLSYIKESVADVLKNYPVEYAILFGSYAKGKANEKSDVDLLLETQVDGLDYFSLIEKLRKTLHKRVDLLRFRDLHDNQVLISEILKTGVRIYG